MFCGPYCPWRCINYLNSASFWCSVKTKTLWFIRSWTSERPAEKTLDTISSGGRARPPLAFLRRCAPGVTPQMSCHVMSLCARLTDRIHLKQRKESLFWKKKQVNLFFILTLWEFLEYSGMLQHEKSSSRTLLFLQENLWNIVNYSLCVAASLLLVI